MIGKVPRQGKSFRGVVNYLLFGKKHEPKPERVAWVETRNLLVTDPKKAATLMRLTAQKSKRVKTPVYHYVISWREDESPTDEVMRMVADTTCKDLGLEEYQMLWVGHRDTDHRHVHIVVNRVHPEDGRAWKNSHDYRRIECSLRRQAEGMGMHYVPGRHNDPECFYGQSRARWMENGTATAASSRRTCGDLTRSRVPSTVNGWPRWSWRLPHGPISTSGWRRKGSQCFAKARDWYWRMEAAP
jgi:MobA/VirD2-like, nuclease domain